MEYQRKSDVSVWTRNRIDNGLSQLKSWLILDAAIKSYVNTYISSLNLGMLWVVDLLEEPKNNKYTFPIDSPSSRFPIRKINHHLFNKPLPSPGKTKVFLQASDFWGYAPRMDEVPVLV